MIQRLSDRLFSDDYDKVLSILLVFAVVVILAGIGLRSPWPADEPRFAEVAREMVMSGNWFFPMRGGELYPDKPPVFMWAIAFFYWLTGNINVSFLLPSALASLITLVCVYDLAAKLWSVKVARHAFWLLMLVPQFVLQAKTAQIDALVTCWITLAMYGFIRHFYIQESWPWFFLSWCFMGLGVITKGVGFLPVFFLIPVMVERYWQHRQFDRRVILKSSAGLLWMLGVIALWLIPMLILAQLSHNPDFMAYRDNILFKQTGERYANAWHHIEPWYYYLVSVIPVFWFPIPLLLLSRRLWRHIFNHPVQISLFAWVALVVLFFSLSPGKRGVYIFPALPMLALICAPWLASCPIHRWIERVIQGVLITLSAAFFVTAVLLIFQVPSLIKHLGDDPNWVVFMLFFLVVGGIWSTVLYRLRNQSSLNVFGVLMGITWLLYSTWGYMLLEPIRTPAKQIMDNIAVRLGDHGELGLVNFKEQFLLFSQQPVTHFSYLSPAAEQYRNAWQWMQAAPDRYILMPQHQNIECFDPQKADTVGYGHRTFWLLYDISSVKASCQPPKQVKQYQMPFHPQDHEGA
ncbi:glycosyltransferase family 39 protein [Photobacterium sp. MCCC 1A19761]|uniref:ArnT family glycosyltransferase n=1 Tax=Photobacterium sp. MCCC 1A19761 TaxID=3115000 RepID=UPI00307F556B